METLPTPLANAFARGLEKYEDSVIKEFLSDSSMSVQKFKILLLNELESSYKLQKAFQANPTSFFAAALFCAELRLSPSSMVGEFIFDVRANKVRPYIGYKGVITLLQRNPLVKKIWDGVVYSEDDFEFELGLDPKMVHIPAPNSKKSNDNIRFVYCCVKIQDETQFKIMSWDEIMEVIKTIEEPSELYFDHQKDPQRWMLKKIVLKQLAKLLPKEDKVKPAISIDDNVDGGAYLMVDDQNMVKVVKSNYVSKKTSLYDNILGDGQ